MMKSIKEPVTHDYLAYGALTVALAAFVIGAHYFYGDFGVIERYLSSYFEGLRTLEPWKAMVGAAVVIVVVAMELIREHKHPVHRDETTYHMSPHHH
jgi:hypothetical protein